ncbi:sensor histidine kinase [Gorillibacterium sp. sgz500922]|uniref:sensor histidine kinase n=1 Tax=Gorillibacterium sp. sgz500922 TaxID=3446694 RepID=UPI003F664C2A
MRIRLWPKTLKNRLFAAVLLFILLPLFLLQLYSYRQIEASVTGEFEDKAAEQLDLMKRSLTDAIGNMFRYYLFLEKDRNTQQALAEPSSMNRQERVLVLEDSARVRSLALPAQVAVTFADRSGQLYLPDGQNGEPGDYEAFRNDPGFVGLSPQSDSYRWVPGSTLSLYALLIGDNGEPFGYLRLEFFYGNWLSETSRDLLLQQSYQLVDSNGTPLGQSDARMEIEPGLTERLIRHLGANDRYQLVDRSGTSILSGTRLYEFDWYLLSYLPMNTYLGNMKEIRSNLLGSYLLLSLAFILVTVFISSAISRSLQLLRRKMAESAAKELRTRVPERLFKGEMQELALTFNTMMEDIHSLLLKLKLEERQKEAVHYQMLTAQMNPHFLLNTLNIIKWNALDKGDEETADICISLGKLLETSLNSEVELIRLKDELDLLQAYLFLQNFRYDGLLTVVYEVEEQLEHALVPKLSLQPLAENAVKHGFARMPEDARITVRARQQGSALVMEIEDNGSGLKPAAKTPPGGRKGIGVANLAQRLQLLFREDGRISLVGVTRGTLARIELPLLIAKPYQSGGEFGVEGTSGGR